MTTIRTVTTDQSNDRTAIPLPTSTPAAGLSNNEVIFWADATTSTLRAEALDNDGDAISLNFSSGITLSVANDWTGQQNFIESTLTDAASVAWDVSTNQNAKVTVTANRTMSAPTNLKAGGKYTLRIIQDGTGSRSMAYNAVYQFDNSIVPPLNTTAGGSTVLYFYSDGTNMHLVASSVERLPMDAASGDLAYYNNSTKLWETITPSAAGTVLKSNGLLLKPTFGSVSGTGDVVGPASSTDNGIVVFDSTTGKIVKASSTTITAGTQIISNVVDPTAAQHASTKNYADTSPTISDLTTTRTLSDTDSGSVISMNNASAIAVTLNTGLKSGFRVTLIQKGAGAITVSGTATLNGTAATTDQYDVLQIFPDAATDVYVGSTGGGSGASAEIYAATELGSFSVVTPGDAPDFTSLAAGYDKLTIEYSALVDDGAAGSAFRVIVNGDTTPTNYHSQRSLSNNGSGLVNEANNNSICLCAGDSATTLRGTGTITIYGYDQTDNYKQFINVHGDTRSTSDLTIGTYACTWLITNAAINRIRFNDSGGNGFAAGTWFKIYGWKKITVRTF